MRFAGFDAFDLDAEPEPEDRELGESVEAVRASEGESIVGSDGERQTALVGQADKGPEDRVFLG